MERGVLVPPALRRWPRAAAHVSSDRRLGDLEAELEQLTMNVRRAPPAESAAVAANGFRFRVPYGTLLCVSDKPLQGVIKLAGMAGDFYRRRVGQHLEIGLRALEKLKSQERETAAFAQAAELRRGRVPVGDGTRIPAGVIHERRLGCPCRSARRYKERRLLAAKRPLNRASSSGEAKLYRYFNNIRVRNLILNGAPFAY